MVITTRLKATTVVIHVVNTRKAMKNATAGRDFTIRRNIPNVINAVKEIFFKWIFWKPMAGLMRLNRKKEPNLFCVFYFKIP